MKTNNRAAVVIIIILLLIGGYFLFKKSDTVEEAPAPITGIENSIHYSCLDGSIDASFGDNAVSLALSDGRSLVLPQVISGSGMRYEQGGIAFIGKGSDAFLQESGKTTYENCVVNAGTTVADETVFVDQGKTISFSYPKDFSLSGGEAGYVQSWRANTQMLGIVLAKLTLPKSTQPSTNLSDSTFTIGTSSDAKAIKSCLVATNGESAAGKVTLGNTTYSVFTLGDAGAGNYYDTTSYRTILNKQCYAVEYTIHSTSLGAYTPDQGIKEFDKQKVVEAMESVVNSFQFLATSAAATETTVTALSLTEDSRCPKDVQCVWAGTVKVNISVTNKNGTTGTSEISLGETKNIAGAFVTFGSVTPEKTQKTL